MGHPVHGATSRQNAQPLPYTIYDRMRDRILSRRMRGYLTNAEYEADIRRINKREEREYQRRKTQTLRARHA